MQHLCKTANDLYKNGRYTEALRLYYSAERKFGPGFASINIALCREKLAGRPDAPFSGLNSLDPITKLLMDNAERNLSEEQRQSLDDLIKNCLAHEDVEPTINSESPPNIPSELTLSPLPESTNDFSWARTNRSNRNSQPENPGLSIIIPTYNRSRILSITLAALVNQKTPFPYEVIVADDGSQENINAIVELYRKKLDITWVWQEDKGFRVSAVRNLGMRAAKYPYIAILDCDMAPAPQWVDSYMRRLIEDDNCAYIGPRRYVDTSTLAAEEVLRDPTLIESLPGVLTKNNVANQVDNSISVDWRLKDVNATENLRLCNTPFRYFAGGNIAFAKKWIDIIGGFDEEFNHWGGEDLEFGYRLYRAGCYFEFLMDALAFHQEPPGNENETDREAGMKKTAPIFHKKVPYFYRQQKEPLTSATIKERPLVSIYIPTHNCHHTLRIAIESALSQTVTDLEVCICDDGSTDGTKDLLEKYYSAHPRVRFLSQKWAGIASASNAAIRMCRGFYIGQLDADDFLEANAVEVCLEAFFNNANLACVYTSYRNIGQDASSTQGYNYPKFSREKLMQTMICHHFRMFTARAWNLTEGFDETLTNAVDYDMFLKLSEVGEIFHINRITYNRYLHSSNTSVVDRTGQMTNHLKAINASLARQGLHQFICTSSSMEADSFDPRISKQR